MTYICKKCFKAYFNFIKKSNFQLYISWSVLYDYRRLYIPLYIKQPLQSRALSSLKILLGAARAFFFIILIATRLAHYHIRSSPHSTLSATFAIYLINVFHFSCPLITLNLI